ncbi:glycosyl hydrolase [Sphingomonas mollis]|uniref:Mannan endo-1,4-beta-mannosidase A and B n=1 Tax=Sphingomonas mollis TaxID=2795726 RepID=A0ABS0XPL8_9SPHN|nr:glycosyl hydrolase [Sphingomonas sp. BT553]MBJ6121984.1 mannan endo-1,4-beta-mannosidase A and B [Sphingomonas sp. BT553]
MTGLTRRTAMIGGAAMGLAAPALARSMPSLSNARASAGARRLYAWLWSQYGRKTLTGQQEQGSAPPNPHAELDYLETVTGRLPAILGLDYIDPADNDAVNARAIDWSRKGGIVTLCWHWGAPDIGAGYENSKKDFDLIAALRSGTPQNVAMLVQMDEVAVLLRRLRDARVPVLWRPLHEFSGDWFWWGKHGPAAFKALWRLMYDRFTRMHGLDNLIWVLGWAGQNVDAAWYPGRATVDIAGADIYAADHGNLAPMFAQVKRIVGDTLPICLHENGPVPDPALLGAEADWLWFMTWHTRWLTGADQNTPELLRRYYASDRYLTRDELPGWLKDPV